jgi:hypothetical protein
MELAPRWRWLGSQGRSYHTRARQSKRHDRIRYRLMNTDHMY